MSSCKLDWSQSKYDPEDFIGYCKKHDRYFKLNVDPFYGCHSDSSDDDDKYDPTYNERMRLLKIDRRTKNIKL